VSLDETPSSVYADDEAWFQSFVTAGIGGAPGPDVVADAIVAAANDPAPALHQPIGDDAAMYLELLSQVDGYEGWMAVATPIVEAAAGPRPTVD